MQQRNELSGEHAILANAERLLNDAQLLFDNGRFPTSAALAVLSIEESGKAHEGMSVGHLAKQKAAAYSGWANYVVGFLEDRGFTIEQRDASSEQNRNSEEVAEFREVLKEALGELKWSELLEQIDNKELSAIKNRGFYVDLDSEGKVLCLPSEIDGIVAGRLIAMARELLIASTAR